ncbi:response regulator [bacterium]|nr:response regulator [bacterium]
MTASTPKTILIIEDNPASIKYIQTHLQKHDFNTVVANGGFDGLNKTRSVKPDLILLDIMLPDLDGHKLCRMIKLNNDLKHIPVAMFTSRDTEEDADMAKKCGADAFILKNTRIQIVIDILNKLIEDSKKKTVKKKTADDKPEEK